MERLGAEGRGQQEGRSGRRLPQVTVWPVQVDSPQCPQFAERLCLDTQTSPRGGAQTAGSRTRTFVPTHLQP